MILDIEKPTIIAKWGDVGTGVVRQGSFKLHIGDVGQLVRPGDWSPPHVNLNVTANEPTPYCTRENLKHVDELRAVPALRRHCRPLRATRSVRQRAVRLGRRRAQGDVPGRAGGGRLPVHSRPRRKAQQRRGAAALAPGQRSVRIKKDRLYSTSSREQVFARGCLRFVLEVSHVRRESRKVSLRDA